MSTVREKFDARQLLRVYGGRVLYLEGFHRWSGERRSGFQAMPRLPVHLSRPSLTLHRLRESPVFVAPGRVQ
jgi:hypothetical protein